MAAEVTVRVAQLADVSAVADLLLAQLREHDIPVGRDHVVRRVTASVSGEGLVLVAASGAVLAGVAYVSFARPLEHAGTIAWLEELYVTPDRRAEGIGGRLVAAVIEDAERRGCLGVELETKRGHERAGHLYVRHGFRDLGRTHFALPLKAWDG
ncbi:MAG: GNAT family N-acetyltransferase [Polyangiaceae bacterium]